MRLRTILTTAALVTATVIGGASTAAADGEPGADALGNPLNSPGTITGPLIEAPKETGVHVCDTAADLADVGNGGC